MLSCGKLSLEGFGDHVFRGEISAPYLKAQGLPENILDSSAWTSDGSADRVGTSVGIVYACSIGGQ